MGWGAIMCDNNYAFVVAASENYQMGLKALFRSIDQHAPYTDIILVSWNLSSIPDSHGNVIVINSDIEHQVHGTAIERFRVASELAGKYDAICLLDADMFLTADVGLFFDIASKGFIVTGSNGMLINFNKEYQEHYHIDLGCDQYPYYKVHTTAPIFLSDYDLDWFSELYNSRRIDSWDDFLYLNILGIKMKKYERMLCMPPYAFTGIHHWQVKPCTRAIEKGGKLISNTEEEIYMVHGKWWDEGWLTGLMDPMKGYSEAYPNAKPEWILDAATKSRDLVKGYFDALCE